MEQSNVIELHPNTEVEAAQEKGDVTVEKATALFSAFDQLNNIKRARVQMNEDRKKMLGDGSEELSDKLSDLISGLTPAQIRELSDDAVEKIYTTEDGEIELTLPLEGKNAIEFKRDFLVYIRETDVANETLDVELAKLEEDIKKDEADLKELLAEFGDLSTFMRTRLQEEFDSAEGEKKDMLASTIASYDDAYTLDRVIAHFEKYGTRNTISDLYHRPENVFSKYMKTISHLNFRTDLTNFNNLERNFLEEKYHEHPNLFIFSIIKMYAYKKDATRTEDGVFLSQLAVNIRSLYADSFGTEEKKEQFKAAIRRVLDLFLGA